MLPFSRYVNLIYYWIVSRIHDPKERKKIDAKLTRFVWGGQTVSDEEWTPSWWRGDEEAGQQGLAVARAFGINVDVNDVRT